MNNSDAERIKQSNISFVIEKLEEIDSQLEHVVQKLTTEGHAGLGRFEYDLLSDAMILTTNLEFMSRIEQEYIGTVAMDEFIEETKSLIYEIREMIYLNSSDVDALHSLYDEFHEVYLNTTDDYYKMQK